ncbi:hypothetical protein SAMN05444169_6927 [Bradyrhizobium erythrophlei]|uniref:Uncharacterized protein n=1 Tax=Bradyrhizobium erythrophlei TaxID=1437360 RepID=A0A1M5S431_9BRAD|nr:hypothetical protein SAMN05444169_6927 [Bradyrhizobium erythrophlei]
MWNARLPRAVRLFPKELPQGAAPRSCLKSFLKALPEAAKPDFRAGG